MNETWTDEQQKVIDLRDRNILVSAAAGSGKTAVLVQRIITMLTQDDPPLNVDELLVVTFTESAAAQMKERVLFAIEEKLKENPADEHLAMQATLIGNAKITTIDSFCQSVIKDHFHAIDLDPSFRVGEEGELRLLRHDVLDELLEDRYASGDPAFLDFSNAYGGGRDDRKLEDLILEVYDYARSDPDPEGWLRSCVSPYEVTSMEELEESSFGQIIRSEVRQCLADCDMLLAQGRELAESKQGPKAYVFTLDADQAVIDTLKEADSFDDLQERLQGVSWQTLKANRDKDTDPEKVAQVKAIREDVKGMVSDLTNRYFYQESLSMLEDLKVTLPFIREMMDVTREFGQRFEEKKRERGLIDFSDMEQYALRILARKEDGKFVPTEVAREYQQQFRSIMIDEYQDSNLLQETILTSVSRMDKGENNLFMVGDVKQSIYRFRLARPELFMDKFDRYSTEASKEQRIDLHQNFRSRREVVESVNAIFRQIMHRDLGGIEYDDSAALYTGASYEDTGADYRTEVIAVNDTDRTWEARAIAQKIRSLKENGKVLDEETKEYRDVKYSDIVILVRSMQGFGDTICDVLSEEGIPAYAGTKEGYFSTTEIGIMLSYLRVLDNRNQDIPLTSVLLSPMGGLREEDLAVIRSGHPDVPFYEAVQLYAASGEDAGIRGKLCACMKEMDALEKRVPYTPIHELILQILDETGYGDFAAAMPGGAQRSANLEMLISQAKAFESTSYKGLFHFVRYMEQLKKYQVDYGEADTIGEQSDTVRIMTIHKSKGLEFPIVFVAGLGKRFNMQDARASVVLDMRLGAGLDAIDLKKRVKAPGLIKKVIQREEIRESIGEELRILYVAFTRAREKLILTGTLADPEKKVSVFRMGGSDYRRLKAGTAWDLLLPAILQSVGKAPVTFSVMDTEEILKGEVSADVSRELNRAALEAWDTDQTYDSAEKERIDAQFSYAYPYADTQDQKLKFTVSELKKRSYLEETTEEEDTETVSGEMLYEEPEVVPLIPKFLQEEGELTGASRGSAYHRVLELLNFQEDYDKRTLRAAVDAMEEKGRLDKEMAECIRPADLLFFLNCDSGRRMKAAAACDQLYREQPFVLGLEAGEIYPEAEEGEMVLVQGIIDVYFEESDGIVVLDYKTDQVSEEKELVDKYHGQLDYYAKALEQMLQIPVKEKIIYSFTLQKEIRV